MHYWGKTFWEFFIFLFFRIYSYLMGRPYEIADDEVQLLVFFFIGCSSAILGSFLIFRKLVMVANAISHTILLGIVVTVCLFLLMFGSGEAHLLHINAMTMIFAALFSSLLTSWLIRYFCFTLQLEKEASIGIVFTFLFALGITVVTLFTRNLHIGVEVIMGNADLLHKDDIWPAAFLFLGNVACIVLLFKEYVVTSFDPNFAKLVNISPLFFDSLLIMQTSMTIVGAFRSIGVVLVLAFLVVPCMTVHLFAHRLSVILWGSCMISSFVSLFSVALSRHILTVYGLAISTSGLMVTSLLIVWTLGVIYRHVSQNFFMSKVSKKMAK